MEMGELMPVRDADGFARKAPTASPQQINKISEIKLLLHNNMTVLCPYEGERSDTRDRVTHWWNDVQSKSKSQISNLKSSIVRRQ